LREPVEELVVYVSGGDARESGSPAARLDRARASPCPRRDRREGRVGGHGQTRSG